MYAQLHWQKTAAVKEKKCFLSTYFACYISLGRHYTGVQYIYLLIEISVHRPEPGRGLESTGMGELL